jgi:hypothetical protein
VAAALNALSLIPFLLFDGLGSIGPQITLIAQIMKKWLEASVKQAEGL